MKKALVIGSNGFVGNELCKYLYSVDCEVTGAFHKNKENLFSKIEHFEIDRALTLVDIDTVFIASAYIPRGKEQIHRDFLYQANVALMERICTAYPDAKIVLSSSVSVYATSEQTISEATVANPNTEYGVSKLWGEKIVAGHDSFAIVRFSSIYGKGMFAGTFLPQIIQSALLSNRISIYGDGSREQNYIYVKDAIAYLIAAARSSENGIFLGTNSRSYSNKKVAEIVQQINPNIVIEMQGSDDSASFYYDNHHSKSQLGIFEEVSLKEGLKTLL